MSSRSILMLWACLGSVALAAPHPTQQGLLALGEVGFLPAAPDRAAKGPEQLAMGPGGLAVLSDPVNREVIVLRDGSRVGAFAVDMVSDLLITPEGRILLLDDAARRLQLWTPDGDLLATWPLPELVPVGGQLSLEDGVLLKVDLFRNRHLIGRLAGDSLGPAQGERVRRPAHVISWDEGRVSVAGHDLDLPDAIAGSAQVFGPWVVVDQVVSDNPIVVDRIAWHQPSGTTVNLPDPAGRSYVPNGDVALAPTGALWVVNPSQAGVALLEVRP